jgi:hypothetical protein
MSDQFTKTDFGRRAYYVEGDIEKVELIVKINGKPHSVLTFREPGLLAIVSKPNEEGLWIEHVEQGGPRYTDEMSKQAVAEQIPREWQFEAIGVK